MAVREDQYTGALEHTIELSKQRSNVVYIRGYQG